MLEVARQVVPASGLQIIAPVLTRLTESAGTIWGLVLGVRYVAAFSRAMNRIYDVHEGRPMWKLEPLLIAITGAIGLLTLAALLLLVISGPLAEAVGNVLQLEDPVVRTWNIAKWPVLLAIVVVFVALLFFVTPNVRQPRFRWLSPGAALAILVWVLASAVFGVYVANFGRYGATYGSLGGVIIFLVWLWLTNTALLFGAVLDAEIERARELQAGIPAEQAPPVAGPRPPRQPEGGRRASQGPPPRSRAPAAPSDELRRPVHLTPDLTWTRARRSEARQHPQRGSTSSASPDRPLARGVGRRLPSHDHRGRAGPIEVLRTGLS